MLRWGDFEAQAPELAARGRELLFQFGPGRASLDTGAGSSDDEQTFELRLEHVLLATYEKPRGEPDNFPSKYTHWHAPVR
jgi:hypothetical protein